MRYKSGITAAILVSICSFSLPLVVSTLASAAGSATLYFSPSTGSFQKGKTITIKVYEDSGGDTINAVQANLMYSTTQFKYVSFTDSPSLGVEAENPSGNTGALDFARGAVNPVSGTQLVVSVRFMIVAGKGTIGVSFASGSAVIRSADNKAEPLAITNAAYSATTPPPSRTAKSSSPSSSSASSTSPSSSTSTSTPATNVTFTPQPAPTETPARPAQHSSGLTITDIQAAAEDANTGAVFTWKTNVPATSTLSYGHDTSHLISTSDGRYVTNHSVLLPNGMLQAGKTYYYYVTSTDKKGSSTKSQLLPFIAASNVDQTPNQTLNSAPLTKAVYGAVAVIACLVIIFGAVRIRRRVMQQQELKRHFPNLETPAENASKTPMVFGPSNKASEDEKGKSDEINDNKIL